MKEPRTAFSRRLGIVVGVRRSNENAVLPPEVYPHVYYVYFQDGQFEGPLFHSQLHDA